jgi:hypothetical protein
VRLCATQSGFAQPGALQVRANSKRDRAKALGDYKKSLARGGSRPLPELFAAAGCRFEFSARTIRPLTQLLREELEKRAGKMCVPQGHFENSPAFQRRESDRITTQVPEGRQTFRLFGNDFLPSLRDLMLMPTGPGIEMPGYCRGFLRNRTPGQKLRCARCCFREKMSGQRFQADF